MSTRLFSEFREIPRDRAETAGPAGIYSRRVTRPGGGETGRAQFRVHPMSSHVESLLFTEQKSRFSWRILAVRGPHPRQLRDPLSRSSHPDNPTTSRRAEGVTRMKHSTECYSEPSESIDDIPLCLRSREYRFRLRQRNNNYARAQIAGQLLQRVREIFERAQIHLQIMILLRYYLINSGFSIISGRQCVKKYKFSTKLWWCKALTGPSCTVCLENI